MTSPQDSPYDALDRIFHEPNRLAIMSVVCAERGGIAFTAIKEACGLTDGNLNRHLKVIEEARAVSIRKRFVNAKPLTTVHLTKSGSQRFQQYLAALNQVLQKAQQAIPATKDSTAIPDAHPAKA